MSNNRLCILLPAIGLLCHSLSAQHLWWNLDGERDATCLYGEIVVLATAPGIYYCGANWHPGEPAGGYCGIQHNGVQERRTIFSIWDTTALLHPQVTEADPKTIFNRFGGEGEGAHTHMLWDWKTNETFRFFVQKAPGEEADTTDTRYYVYDRERRHWVHSATIRNPNDGKASVSTISGGLNCFLENFLGRDKNKVKLALYRLWLGKNVEGLRGLTRAKGDGMWGQLHDAYFLAEGDRKELQRLFGQFTEQYENPRFGGTGTNLNALAERPLPADVLRELTNLPRAAKVRPGR